MLVAAFGGLSARMAAQMVGKRIMMVLASSVMLIAAVGHMHAGDWEGTMAARVFEGLSWGVLEACVWEGIGEVFFVSCPPLVL